MLMMGRGPVGSPIQYPRPVNPVMPVSPTGPSPVRIPVSAPSPIGPAPTRQPILGQFHKGGKVQKTGNYRLKKGEHVIAKGQRKLVNHGPQKLVSIAALKA